MQAPLRAPINPYPSYDRVIAEFDAQHQNRIGHRWLPSILAGARAGPKASGVTDENLIVIQGNRDLASQYAGKIMEIYSQYRWRASVQSDRGKPKWEGLADDDKWQIEDPSQPCDKRRLRELGFWFGATTATGAAGSTISGSHGPKSHALKQTGVCGTSDRRCWYCSCKALDQNCQRCRRNLCWNYREAFSGGLKLSDHAARSMI